MFIYISWIYIEFARHAISDPLFHTINDPSQMDMSSSQYCKPSQDIITKSNNL